MIAFADRPLKELVAKQEGMDADMRWGRDIMVDVGQVNVECKNGKKYSLCLGVVSRDYTMDMGDLEGEPDVLKSMSHLIYCAQCHFKIMKVGTRTLKVDVEKSTLYLHSQDAYRIGIIINTV